VSHINGRVRRWVNDGYGDDSGDGSGDTSDEQDSGWSRRTARRGDWARLNRYELDRPPSGVDDMADLPVDTGPVDDYHVTLRCRLDIAALRYLAERADLLGLEIIDVRPAGAGGGHDG
jgi:hypothetical protein